jgi:hypothetical protein
MPLAGRIIHQPPSPYFGSDIGTLYDSAKNL